MKLLIIVKLLVVVTTIVVVRVVSVARQRGKDNSDQLRALPTGQASRSKEMGTQIRCPTSMSAAQSLSPALPPSRSCSIKQLAWSARAGNETPWHAMQCRRLLPKGSAMFLPQPTKGSLI